MGTVDFNASSMIRLLRHETKKVISIFLNPSFIYLTLLGNSLLVSATVAVYFLEKGSNPKMNTYFDSFWWGVTTITTVAYGDILPMTFWGRVIAIGLMYRALFYL